MSHRASDGFLTLEVHSLAKHKIERLDMFVEVVEFELQLLARFQIEQSPVLVVPREDEARLLCLMHPLQVIERLSLISVEIEPPAFQLDEQRAWPEQVDETVLLAQKVEALLVDCDLPPLHAENIEEGVVEGLRFGALARLLLELVAERLGASCDFVPA